MILYGFHSMHVSWYFNSLRFFSIGCVSSILERMVASSGNDADPTTVSRYPLAPLCAALVMLYVHALFPC